MAIAFFSVELSYHKVQVSEWITWDYVASNNHNQWRYMCIGNGIGLPFSAFVENIYKLWSLEALCVSDIDGLNFASEV